MKFDFIIGNPPYQETCENTSDSPVYHYFMDSAYSLSDKVELITPARFLSNAGKTPKDWNLKRLSDSHFKVLDNYIDSSDLFPNTDIKGGVVITYRDAICDFGSIGVYSPFKELRSIFHKVFHFTSNFDRLQDIMFTQYRFNLDVLYKDYPELQCKIGSKGKERRLISNVFTKLSIFTEERTLEDDVKIYGVIKNVRVCRYIKSIYLDLSHETFGKWKVLIPASNGSGALGEVLSTPLIGTPLIGYTQTFIGVGCFETELEAQNCLKYVKSKFARTMLGICKSTQSGTPDKWAYVPLQDFTSNSDIDWSVSVAEVDQQLYQKYGLDESEIEFIETHVTAME